MTEQAENSLQLLQPLNRARIFQNLINNDHLTKSAIAEKYHKSLAYVSNTVRLLKLPELIQEGLSSLTISEGHARALLSAESKMEMITIYKNIIINKISVRETEALVRNGRKTRRYSEARA